MDRGNPRRLRVAGSLLLPLALVSACATGGWFKPVAGADNASPVMCAADGPGATSIVVAVRVDTSVEHAAFTVKPIESFGPVFDQGHETRGGVNILPQQTTCVRLPLPAPLAEMRRYNISVSGYRGGKHVLGGEIACVPKIIRNWGCTVQ